MHQPIDRQPIDGQPMDQIRQNRQLQPSQYGATAPQWREWDDEDTIDLREYWQMLVRRRLTVLSILVLAFVGGLLVTFLTTPIFRATLLLQI
ncbi:MAG: hypothetical protein KJO08_03550, partial [Gammaproteobacteria bacterium]|nr:hypothetical protein [Gammaproteobacteria bacterium]NNJ84535.1 hypothetical protein [Gammaproteobacteria bacterium]